MACAFQYFMKQINLNCSSLSLKFGHIRIEIIMDFSREFTLSLLKQSIFCPQESYAVTPQKSRKELPGNYKLHFHLRHLGN